MFDFDEDLIKDFICNETSSFALAIINIENKEVLYTNKAMKKIMLNKESKKCWEALYGHNQVCPWCNIKDMSDNNNNPINEKIEDFEYEYFNEMTNSWFQIQNKITTLNDGRNILVSIAIDISKQKKSQGDLITTQVKLVRQTQKLEEMQIELKLLASQDYMTKLYNRRYFTETSVLILDLAKRNKTDSSIIMIDIDNFKNINDTYGHNIGDKVIIELSNILQKQTRKSDILSRWGGEEFIILLPNTKPVGATVLAEKMRQSVNQMVLNFKSEIQLQFTISIGIAEVDREVDTSIENVVNRADKALYEAKNTGRNKICVFKSS